MNTYDLEERMKKFETIESKRKLMPLPTLARMDGINFHNFCKDLEKPFDENFSKLMIEITLWLAQEFNANCAYTESDEISLGWFFEDKKTELYGGWRILKLNSHLAAKATWKFNALLSEFLPQKKDSMACFDSRVWNAPDLDEAVVAFWSRETDATRNSLEGAARCYFSHNECFKKNSSTLNEMLFSKGINWNNYPNAFKRGTFIVKKKILVKFSKEELDSLPEKHEARKNPNLLVERNIWHEYNSLPKFGSVVNKKEFLFSGADPFYENTRIA